MIPICPSLRLNYRPGKDANNRKGLNSPDPYFLTSANSRCFLADSHTVSYRPWSFIFNG